MSNPTVNFNTPLLDRNNGCWFYRQDVPARALRSRGWAVSDKDPSAQIQVFARTYSIAMIHHAEDLRRAGKTVVFDIDDDYWAVSPMSPHAVEITPSLIAGIDHMIKNADLVTVSTENLRKVVQDRFKGKKVIALPNSYDTSARNRGKPHRDLKEITGRVVLLSGSASHAGDFLIIPRIAERLKGVTWVVLAPRPFMDLVPGAVYLHPVGLDDYLATLRAIGTRQVVGVVPLTEERFNRSKSGLKWVEYAGSSIPGVYSDYGEYPLVASAFTRAGATAVEWVDAIEKAFANREALIGQDFLTFAETGPIEKNIHHWEEAYIAARKV